MARSTRFPVAIVGAGALGTLFFRKLSRICPTALVGRRATTIPQADWVIVLVKAYDTAAAVKTARRMRAKGVVSLQNGLTDLVPQGVTTAAAYRAGKRVIPVAAGKTVLPPGFEPLARLLRRAGLDARVAKDIHAARLRKLLANVCLNPVTALFRVKNHQVLEPRCLPFVQALAAEAAQVLSREGVRTSPSEALRRVVAVAQATAGNRSSMLQDVLAGRRTEIEHLTGALLRLARRHRVAVPTHHAFYQLIRIIEEAR